MADDKSKQIDDVFERLARVQRDQERAAGKLAQAFDNLGDRAAAVLAEKMKKAAKDFGVLSDEQASLIKSASDLTDALKQQEEKYDKAQKALEEYRKELKKIKDHENSSFYTSKKQSEEATKLANKNYDAELEKLGLTRKTADQLGNGLKSMKAHATTVEGVTSTFKSLGGVIARITPGLEKMGKGIKQGYNEFVKLSKIGLQGTLIEVNKQAMALRMSFDEFSDAITKNTETINLLGGGADGIAKFAGNIKEASENLAYMGRDGIDATIRFNKTLQKMGSTMRDPAAWKKTMEITQKSFSKMNAVWHMGYEEFADLTESQMAGESVQARLNRLTQDQANAVRAEILKRTENMKALGLSTEQIKDFTKNVEETFSTKKNNQVQKMQEAIFSKQALSNMISQTGDQGLASHKRELEQYFDMVSGGATPDQLNKFRSDHGEAFQAYAGAREKMTQQHGAAYASGNPNATWIPYLQNMLEEKGGATMAGVNQYGQATNQADRQGLKIPHEQMAKLEQTAMNVANAHDALSESLKSARLAAEQFQSVINNTAGVIGSGLLMVLGGLIGVKGFGGLFGVLGRLIPTIGGLIGVKGFGGLFGVLGRLMKIPAIGAAVSGIEGAIDGLQTDTAEYYQRMSLDPSGAGDSILKDTVVRTIGVLSDVGAAAGRIATFGMWDPSKDFADKQLKAASATAGASNVATSTVGTGSNPLGNLIARGESGAAGYNANNKGTVGNRIVAGNKEDLSQMTIGDVMKRQALPSGDPNRLFAVGKYQMIPSTFKDAVQDLKLDKNQQFTPDVQEQMFQWLITKKRPQIGAYISGKSNDMNGAMLAASKEWASIADPRTGKSYYGGANSASIGTGELSSTLQTMRAANNLTPGSSGSAMNIPTVATLAPSQGTATPVQTSSSTKATGNPVVDELQRHTALLTQIASNTMSYKPSSAPSEPFKRPASEVANKLTS